MGTKSTTSFILIVRSFTRRPNHDMEPLFYLRTETRFQLTDFTMHRTGNLSISCPFTLTYPKHIRFTRSLNSCLLHMCLHRIHHLELHPISNKHARPRSDIRCSPNTTLSNQLTIAFASLSLQMNSI